MYKGSERVEVLNAVEGLLERFRLSKTILFKHNNRLSYETRGYRFWVRFRGSKTVVEYMKELTVDDVGLWYEHIYLGSIMAGKYTKPLILLATLLATILVILLGIDYAFTAVLVVGLVMILDYALYIYRSVRLTKAHRVLLEEDEGYRERYNSLVKELVSVVVGSHSSLRTIVFLGRVWFIKRSGNHILLSKEPI